jgi:hypothetical protein
MEDRELIPRIIEDAQSTRGGAELVKQRQMETNRELEAEIFVAGRALLDRVFKMFEADGATKTSDEVFLHFTDALVHVDNGDVFVTGESGVTTSPIAREREWVFDENKEVSHRWISVDLPFNVDDTDRIMTELGETYRGFTVRKRIAIGQERYRYTLDGGETWIESDNVPFDIVTRVFLKPLDESAEKALQDGTIEDPFRTSVFYEPFDVNMTFFDRDKKEMPTGFSYLPSSEAGNSERFYTLRSLQSKQTAIQELQSALGTNDA